MSNLTSAKVESNVTGVICTSNIHGDIDFVAAAFYFPFVIYGIVLGVFILKTRHTIQESIVLIMITVSCLVLSFVLRSIWFCIHCLTPQSVDMSSGWAAALLATLAPLLFFTAFSVYVFSWARLMNRAREVTLRNSVVFGNVVLYIVVIALAGYFAATNEKEDFLIEGTDSDVIHLIIAGSDLLLSVAFAGYGACALKLMQQIRHKARTMTPDAMNWRMYVRDSSDCSVVGCHLLDHLRLHVVG